MAATPTKSRSFKVHACLGRGGFGEVYRATMFSEAGSTDVAVKILHATMEPESQAVQRLRDERRILAALLHPSILRVHDLTVIEGRIALVTEFVEGQDLDKCTVEPASLSPRAVLEVVVKVADALHAAFHSPAPNGEGDLELVHRDIKPANIRIGRRGEVRLLDFGVARAANVEREAQTASDSVFGSYPYMAPERFLGGNSGPEGDVYGLGCTLYEAMCRHRLWQLPLSDIYTLVMNPTRYHASLSERLDLIPDRARPVRALLRSMLAFDPQDRPAAAEICVLAETVMPDLAGPPLEAWCLRRAWPKPKVLPGLLSGRVFLEDTMDPEDADNQGRALAWEANDQDMTVRVSGPSKRFDDGFSERSTSRKRAKSKRKKSSEPAKSFTSAARSSRSWLRWGGGVLGLLAFLALCFVGTFVLVFILLRMYG